MQALKLVYALFYFDFKHTKNNQGTRQKAMTRKLHIRHLISYILAFIIFIVVGHCLTIKTIKYRQWHGVILKAFNQVNCFYGSIILASNGQFICNWINSIISNIRIVSYQITRTIKTTIYRGRIMDRINFPLSLVDNEIPCFVDACFVDNQKN